MQTLHKTFSDTWTTLESNIKMVKYGFPTTWKVTIKIKREGKH